MYKSNVEAMPRELKTALVSIGIFEKIDNIVSLEKDDLSKEIVNQFKKALSDIGLPNYWVVTNKLIFETFYLVFERKLTDEEEQKLFIVLPDELAIYLGIKSLSCDYSIY